MNRSRIIEVCFAIIKKPTWLTTRRGSTTSVYFLTSHPFPPGCSLVSLPTISTYKSTAWNPKRHSNLGLGMRSRGRFKRWHAMEVLPVNQLRRGRPVD